MLLNEVIHEQHDFQNSFEFQLFGETVLRCIKHNDEIGLVNHCQCAINPLWEHRLEDGEGVNFLFVNRKEPRAGSRSKNIEITS